MSAERRLPLSPLERELRGLAYRYTEAPPLGLAPRSPAHVTAEQALRAACAMMRLAEERWAFRQAVGEASDPEAYAEARQELEQRRAHVARQAMAWYRALAD